MLVFEDVGDGKDVSWVVVLLFFYCVDGWYVVQGFVDVYVEVEYVVVWQFDVCVISGYIRQCMVVFFYGYCSDVYIGCVLFQVLGVNVLQGVVFVEDVVDQQYVVVEQ